MIAAILILSGIVIILIILMIVIIKFSIGENQELEKENFEFKQIIVKQENNLIVLQNYHSAADEIKKNNKEIVKKIKEAKTDEDSYFCITNIIDANNKRVQNQ